MSDMNINLKLFIILGSIAPIFFIMKWVFYHMRYHRPEFFPDGTQITHFDNYEKRFRYWVVDYDNKINYEWNGKKWTSFKGELNDC
jgi:hypothetical protein